MEQATKTQKIVEDHPIAIGVGSRAEEFRETPTGKGVILAEKKFYSPALPFT